MHFKKSFESLLLATSISELQIVVEKYTLLTFRNLRDCTKKFKELLTEDDSYNVKEIEYPRSLKLNFTLKKLIKRSENILQLPKDMDTFYNPLADKSLKLASYLFSPLMRFISLFVSQTSDEVEKITNLIETYSYLIHKFEKYEVAEDFLVLLKNILDDQITQFENLLVSNL